MTLHSIARLALGDPKAQKNEWALTLALSQIRVCFFRRNVHIVCRKWEDACQVCKHASYTIVNLSTQIDNIE